jgi:hypothetical protein
MHGRAVWDGLDGLDGQMDGMDGWMDLIGLD